MNEKTKLLWLLAAINNTLERRMLVSQELLSYFQSVTDMAIAELDPEQEIHPPNIMYFVGDFKLPKELLERIPR